MSEVISKTRFNIYGYLKGFILSTGMEQDLFDVPQPETIVENVEINGSDHPRFVNEFWTSRQRQACPLHEVAYRACFKPQLPRFFIKILTRPNDIVYDPFGGRGTTVLEAGILGRNVMSNDVNPLSRILSYPRFFVPDLWEVEARLNRISIDRNAKADIDLSMFYHSGTEAELMSLRNYLLGKRQTGSEDNLDAWIRMVATNRLTGHSPGFFSVYTLPPNQAVSPENQIRINQRRRQSPEYRDLHKLILRKTKSLTNGISRETVERLKRSGDNAIFLSKDSRNTSEIAPDSVQLTVTSPPFLNVVQYAKDNWLRCWFNGINAEEVSGRITMCRSVEDWTAVMEKIFVELFRITKPQGWVAFEVGEIRNGKINLDEYVVPLGLKAGFRCEGIMVNQQEFTKTANIWGVNNNEKGTNSNRIVIFHKGNCQRS
jgi:hypothetical protein